MGTRRASTNLDIILGILIGIAATMLLTTSRWFWEHGLKDYQELLSGCLALIGAAAAVAVVNRQIRHAQEMEDKRLTREDERRARHEYAIRTMLPHALNSLCEYADSWILELKDALPEGRPLSIGDQVALSGFVTRVPEEVMSTLKDNVEVAEVQIRDRLAEIVELLQVQRSRSNPSEMLYPDRVVGANYYYMLVKDVLEIYVRADMLFAYARRTTDVAPGRPEASQLIDRADMYRFDESHWGSLHAKLRDMDNQTRAA